MVSGEIGRGHPRIEPARSALVSGATDGIGRATACALANLGWRVILLARDPGRGAATADEIARETGNPRVESVPCDLSRMASVRAAAAEIARRAPSLDVLVNNAAATFSDFGLTEDGIERTAATNHVGPFLLTGLLLESLRAAPAGRVVNVASNGHRRTDLDLAAFTRDDAYFVLRAYDRSKLANVLFTVELAERLRGGSVTANCLHPGRIATRIGEKDGMRGPHRLAWRAISRITGHGPEAGARPVIHLAVADEVAGVTGRYFTGFSALANRPLVHIREERMHACVADAGLRRRLWALSEELSGARFPA
ncbi:MAG: SDR family NAD(P)-dependent oxidoreductase [Alphaproteobacteria bacterium]